MDIEDARWGPSQGSFAKDGHGRPHIHIRLVFLWVRELKEVTIIAGTQITQTLEYGATPQIQV